jgi:hypothetical protein
LEEKNYNPVGAAYGMGCVIAIRGGVTNWLACLPAQKGESQVWVSGGNLRWATAVRKPRDVRHRTVVQIQWGVTQKKVISFFLQLKKFKIFFLKRNTQPDWILSQTYTTLMRNKGKGITC